MATRVSELYRTAFVTGASTGLGRAFAEMLLADGVQVWGTSRRIERLQAVRTPAGARLHAVALDLNDGPGAEAAFHASEGEAGGFDLMINNAGYGVFAEFTHVDFSVWQRQLEVMLLHTARLTWVAARSQLARKRGALVNISSLAVEFPLPYQSAYNMAKAGLTALNESLMVELAGTGVIVLDVRPGDYRTDFEESVHRPPGGSPRLQRAWDAFSTMMRSGPPPEHAARALRRALLQRRSGTLRTGRFFQATLAPLLSRLGSLSLKRRIQARYFHV